jgi:hypothetical protein
MWEDNDYAWVVVCKNHWFHFFRDRHSGHRIPLGEALPYMSPPAVGGPLMVRCDQCGKEYAYQPKEILKSELKLPEAFKPHPLFEEAE